MLEKKISNKKILLLKSAFTLIDDIFKCEMEIAYNKRKHTCFGYQTCYYKRDKRNPLALNEFTRYIMDPFKDLDEKKAIEEAVEAVCKDISNNKNIIKKIMKRRSMTRVGTIIEEDDYDIEKRNVVVYVN